MMVEITDMQRDALREVGNIGAGRAVITLSEFVNTKIREGLSFMDIVPIKNIVMFMGGPKQKMTIIHAPVEGDIAGMLFTMFPGNSSFVILDMMDGKDIGTTTSLTEEGKKKIIDVGKALSKTYLGTMVEFLNMDVRCEGQAGILHGGHEVLDSLDLSKYSHALMLETDFGVPDTELEGDFIMVLTDESLDKVLVHIDQMMDK